MNPAPVANSNIAPNTGLMIAHKPYGPSTDYLLSGFKSPEPHESGLTINRPFANNQEAMTTLRQLQDQYPGMTDYKLVPSSKVAEWLGEKKRGRLDFFLEHGVTQPRAHAAENYLNKLSDDESDESFEKLMDHSWEFSPDQENPAEHEDMVKGLAKKHTLEELQQMAAAPTKPRNRPTQ